MGFQIDWRMLIEYFEKILDGGIDWLMLGGYTDIFLLVYLGVSILLELLEIFCYLTPSKEDDRFVARVKDFWFAKRKFLLLFSVRTPISLMFLIIHFIISRINKLVRKKTE